MTLYGGSGVDQAWAYEYASNPPVTCPNLPFFWGPSSNGAHVVQPSGCPGPPEGWNCNLGILGQVKNKWCYRYRHILSIGPPGCNDHVDWITHGNVDLTDKSPGVVADDDVDAFAELLGTRCNHYTPGGPTYSPVADFNKDGYIDASDLSMLAAHYEHKCSDWQPTGHNKVTTLAEYPWHVFDSPAMQRAMANAGIDRDFVVRIWELNGAEQRLFARGEQYDREAHLASVASLLPPAPTGVEGRLWGKVKVFYR
jgi:hypothetical protein